MTAILVTDIKMLDLDMVDEIHKAFAKRRELFADSETDADSLAVVLLNYGDSRRIAHCTTGDWSGPKSEMEATPSGLPVCPRCGRSALEDRRGWGLALVETER